MKSLLDNVSLFWSKYFKDVDILYSLLRGAVDYVSRCKQEVYSYVLSSGLDTVPLELREDLSLEQLEDSNFKVITTDSGDTFLVYELGEDSRIRSLPYLLAHPEAESFLENNKDYLFFLGDSTIINSDLANKLDPKGTYILFNKDPRVKGNYPDFLPRTESGYILGNYKISGISTTPRFTTNTVLEALNKNKEKLQEVRVALHDESNDIYLHIYSPIDLPDSTEYLRDPSGTDYLIGEIETFIYPNNSLQVWAANCKKDTNLLQDLYGISNTTVFTRSSERYRNFLLGINSLRTRPFTVNNIKSSLCLCANIPIFTTSYADGDRIIRVDYTSEYSVVYTTQAKYQIPVDLTLDPRIAADAIELSIDGIQDVLRPPTHTQTFAFKELDPLITDIVVRTGIDSDTSWWDRGLGSSSFIEIPEEIMLGEPLNRRTVINNTHPNEIGGALVNFGGKQYKLPPAAIGDHGIQIGQTTRNTVAYTLFNDFIKHHVVFIDLSYHFFNLQELNSSPEILRIIRETLESSSSPGTVVILGLNMEAFLVDSDGDGIPDIIDPN